MADSQRGDEVILKVHQVKITQSLSDISAMSTSKGSQPRCQNRAGACPSDKHWPPNFSSSVLNPLFARGATQSLFGKVSLLLKSVEVLAIAAVQ